MSTAARPSWAQRQSAETGDASDFEMISWLQPTSSEKNAEGPRSRRRVGKSRGAVGGGERAGRRKEEGGRRKEEGGRRKEEGGRRKEEGGRRKEEGGGEDRDLVGAKVVANLHTMTSG
eukprot:762715-Hanusia_phi.AAC.8